MYPTKAPKTGLKTPKRPDMPMTDMPMKDRKQMKKMMPKKGMY